jgi:tetratricopeptide (TPR) repeat protein
MFHSALVRTRTLIGTVTLASFVAVAGSPEIASAQEASTEAVLEERKAEAKAQFEKGATLYREQRYEEAVIAFLAADRLTPNPALSFNIARAYERLDDTSSALRWYRDYLRRAPDAGNAGDVEAKVRSLDGVLVLRGLQQVTILSSPPGASVTVDGRDVGVTPYTGDHSIGERAVTLKVSDYREKRFRLDLTSDAPRELNVDLSRVEPAPAPTAASTAPAAVREPSAETRFGVAPYIVAGSGGVLLAFALGFELARRSEESKAEDARSQIEFAGHVESMEDMKTTSRIFLGLGSAALVTGGVLYFLNERRESPAPVAFGCSPHGCAATAQGTF